jgi:hypothetical protein
VSRTPSGWHDDARGRDAGHDEMQLRHFRWWCRRKGQVFAGKHHEGWIIGDAYCELPIVLRGRIVAFVDVGIVLHHPDDKSLQHFLLAEIKPKIESVGAVVRQLRAIEHAAGASMEGTYNTFAAAAVVYEDDPKLNLLRETGVSVVSLTREPLASELPQVPS